MAALTLVVAGCAGEALLVENPAFVPQESYDALWERTVDVVDDYFEITEEDRIDGRIETLPRVGATLLEPWHRDAANLNERVEGTLQSIRRRASVRILPNEAGYFVEVSVIKELEDLPVPQFATTGEATFRHNDVVKERPNTATDAPPTPGWIEIGRDAALEQQILRRVHRNAGGR